jgi:hypothetical protein
MGGGQRKASGDNGDIWIADGYAVNVFRGMMRQATIPRRLMERREQALSLVSMGYGSILAKDQLELYIAGRGNHRVQVHDAEGNYSRCFGVCRDSSWSDTTALSSGKFNDPLAATTETAGNIFVVEWRVGGRILKLEK